MSLIKNTINEVIMISQQEYAQRRQNVRQQIGENAIAIIPAASQVLRNGDTPYVFRQDSNFYYLTGFNESDAILVLLPGHDEGEYILFAREKDPAKEIWDGKMQGLQGVIEHFHADMAYDINSFEEVLPRLLENRKKVYFPISKCADFDQLIFACVNQLRGKARQGINAAEEFCNIDPILSEMRVFKSEAEIAVMQKAADISVKAHKRAMQTCTPGMYEYQLEAEMQYVFYKHGSRAVAYSPIIGSGKNACILHYKENNQQVADGDLVLIDAGCEYENYSSDITRTFPTNGHFSQEQAAIYNLVLKAQLAAIELVKPGTKWFELQARIMEIFTVGLVELGLLKGDISQLITEKAATQFYMHLSGHWLGLDTHDTGNYKINNEWRELEPGMVLTIEPGLYIQANQADVDPKWWNIGVRIEDDIAVTESGHQILTEALPKTIKEIETLMSDKLQ